MHRELCVKPWPPDMKNATGRMPFDGSTCQTHKTYAVLQSGVPWHSGNEVHRFHARELAFASCCASSCRSCS
jgi:hypothetical protein